MGRGTMSGMDDYYRLLGLNPGASEEEIKEAYKDLIKVWHPDRFSNDPRLKEKANEKLKEINSAYEILKAYMAGRSESFRGLGESGTHADSQPPPHEPPPEAEKERNSKTEDEGYEGFQPSPKEPPDQKPHGETHGRINPEGRFKPFFSWPNISFFICYGFGLAKSIAKYGDLTANSFGESLGISILPIIFFVIYNSIKGEAKTIRILSIIANLLFLFLFLSSILLEITGIVSTTQSEHDTSTAFVSPSSPPTGESSSARPSPRKEKLPDWMTDAWLASIDIPKEMIWKILVKNSQGSTFYYDTKYTVRLENINRVPVWTKTVYGDKAISRKTTQSGGNYEKVAFSLEFNDIDCMKQIARRLEVFHYSEEGVCIDYSKTPSEWISIPSNTVLEVLQKEVCR